MTNITFNIEDILSKDEIKEIARDEVRNRIRNCSDNDLERIITNSAYHVIWQAVEEVYDGEAEAVLREKTVAVLEDVSNFNVFSKPNAWDRTAGSPYETLCKVVLENKDLLDSQVKKGVNKLSQKDLKEIAKEVLLKQHS